jgi:hypothetical protein
VPSFLEHRKRSEQALISVIQEAVAQGVSTRKIVNVLAEFGLAGVSAGEVSQLCAALDEKVRQFRERPLGETATLGGRIVREGSRGRSSREHGGGDRDRRDWRLIFTQPLLMNRLPQDDIVSRYEGLSWQFVRIPQSHV